MSLRASAKSRDSRASAPASRSHRSLPVESGHRSPPISAPPMTPRPRCLPQSEARSRGERPLLPTPTHGSAAILTPAIPGCKRTLGHLSGHQQSVPGTAGGDQAAHAQRCISRTGCCRWDPARCPRREDQRHARDRGWSSRRRRDLVASALSYEVRTHRRPRPAARARSRDEGPV